MRTCRAINGHTKAYINRHNLFVDMHDFLDLFLALHHFFHILINQYLFRYACVCV